MLTYRVFDDVFQQIATGDYQIIMLELKEFNKAYLKLHQRGYFLFKTLNMNAYIECQ